MPAKRSTVLVTGAVSIVVMVLAIVFLQIAFGRIDRDLERAQSESQRVADGAEADLQALRQELAEAQATKRSP